MKKKEEMKKKKFRESEGNNFTKLKLLPMLVL